MGKEYNEMEQLERNILRKYNELLKILLEEGDMDTLEQVITDEEYRERLISVHTQNLQNGHEI